MSTESFAHRILSRLAESPVRAGDRVRLTPDATILSGARTPSTVVRVRGLGTPAHPERLVLNMDFLAPEVESEVRRSRALCREFAEELGLPYVYDLNLGIGSHVVLESGRVDPGNLAVGCGRCLGVVGGVGALGLRWEEEDLARSIVAGDLTVEVPGVVRVEVKGRPPRWAGAWDVAREVRRALGDAISGRVVELAGEVEEWGIDFRMGLCGLLAEMGAVAALVPPDARTVAFYEERGRRVAPESGIPAADAYEASIVLDAARTGARGASEYGGSDRSLPEEGGEPVQGVFIGSCYGGRYEDLSLVAEVLKKQGQVHPRVRLAVSPATLETARACLMAGFYEIFLQAGAMIVVPGGGPGTAGGGTVFGEGERIASTAEYHRQLGPGQGVPEVTIVSPAAAAAAATTGALLDPARLLA